jgi:hypothetical protein
MAVANPVRTALGMRMILCGNDVGLLFSAAQERANFVRSCTS